MLCCLAREAGAESAVTATWRRLNGLASKDSAGKVCNQAFTSATSAMSQRECAANLRLFSAESFSRPVVKHFHLFQVLHDAETVRLFSAAIVGTSGGNHLLALEGGDQKP